MEPTDVVPSRNVTMPVAVEGVTVAVSVTGLPDTCDAGSAVRLVVVAPRLAFTCRLTAVEVLAANVALPEYAAINAWLPNANVVESVAEPDANGTFPREVAPSKKVTLPPAVDGEIAAVSITVCPATAGFGDTVS